MESDQLGDMASGVLRVKNLKWKLGRMRAMSPSEIFYRAHGLSHTYLEKAGYCRARPVLPTGKTGKFFIEHFSKDFDATSYRAAADRVLAGVFDVFAMRDQQLGFPPNWNLDPKTGTQAPLTFGKSLNYRDPELVGDIKYLWEPNRHAELVILAQAWHLTGDVRYEEGCKRLLDSWFLQCPYPLGANWTSSLEHACRLVNWSIAWFLLGDGSIRDRDTEFRRRWLDSIYQHCHFIAGHFSRYSSANNHLLGELMGLFIGSVVWPLWSETAQWSKLAATEFEAEILQQNAEDGVNREQAIWYQHEVADMMLIVALLGRANGIKFSAVYWQRLERMLEFISAVMDANGNVPMVGDADDARLLRLAPVNVYRSLLATGAILFDRGDFKVKAKYYDDKNRWLFGQAGHIKWNVLPPATVDNPRRAFSASGYHLLGNHFGSDEEVSMLVDAAPLGYLSIAAHGHADALAVTLSVGGNPVLVDPGTYAYHTQGRWRNYFRGTSAHNTVRVDGMDQSVIGGSFLWHEKANARTEVWETSVGCDRFVGSHDGYFRLADKVLHRREITFDKLSRTFKIIDYLDCQSRHDIELFWHFAPTWAVSFDENLVTAKAHGQTVMLSFDGHHAESQLFNGDDDLPLGWYSEKFDEKIPTTTVRRSSQIDGLATFVTLISVA